MNAEPKLKIKVGADSLYLYALVLYMIWRLLCNGISWIDSVTSVVGTVRNVCNYAIIVLLIISYVKDLISKPRKYHLIILIVISLIFISYKTTGESQLLYTSIFVLLAGISKLDFKRICNVYFKTLVILFAIIIISFLIGLTTDVQLSFSYGVGHSLGMSHPNNFAALAMNIIIMWYCLYLKKNFILMSVVTCVLSYIIFKITACRTVTILLTAFVIYVLVYKLLNKIKITWLLNILTVALYITVFGAILLMFNYSNANINFFSDTNFVTRFKQAYIISNQYGLSLFGNNISFLSISDSRALGTSSVVLDSGILRLFLYHGIVVFILFIIGETLLIRKIVINKKYILLGAVIIFLMSGLMESSLYMLQYNFTLFGIVSYFNFNQKENGALMNETCKI
jgi:hypothetical protein